MEIITVTAIEADGDRNQNPKTYEQKQWSFSSGHTDVEPDQSQNIQIKNKIHKRINNSHTNIYWFIYTVCVIKFHKFMEHVQTVCHLWTLLHFCKFWRLSWLALIYKCLFFKKGNVSSQSDVHLLFSFSQWPRFEGMF